MNTLPDLPSELIELALNDLAAIERTPGYEVFMVFWHYSSPIEKVCRVCLAGAVMARELDVPSYADSHPALFDEDIERKLEALEEFRTGWVLEALGTLGIDIPQGVIDHMPVVNYHINREGFYRDMRRIIDLLRSFNL